MSSQLGHSELLKLLEAVCEDRLSAVEHQRLEDLLKSDPQARRLYREYLHLHGSLYWDTAVGSDEGVDLPRQTVRTRSEPVSSKRWQRVAWASGAVAAMVAISFIFLNDNYDVSNPSLPVVENREPPLPDVAPERPVADVVERKPVGVQAIAKLPEKQTTDPQPSETVPSEETIAGASDETILAFVDDELTNHWVGFDVQPSPVATDGEWLRRVSLDLIGQIPSVEEAEAFLNDTDPRKREKLVDSLLDRPEFITNWSTIWANLMVGRTPNRAEYRHALTKFLRDSFRENRPWDDVVAAVISAEGSIQDDLASGFLLAHVNNQAVPATAIAARLFLGTNVQCTQCHDHPFNDSKQNQFWELNSFFKQTDRVVERHRDPETGIMTQTVSLVTRSEAEGPTFFENRRGEVQPAFPIYNGIKVDEGAGTNRREELSKLLATGEKPQIAEAYVNRLWKHFFGFGFTNPVDDMGPHNPPSHPQLLDRLSREFVASGFDQKRLMKWICLSEAYQRTSRITDDNEIDNPELGELPLFSRVYVKSMSVEQVYQSLLVATGVMNAQRGSWDAIEQTREAWLQQFIETYETEENNEDTHFSGTIAQALMLMNGDLIQQGLDFQSPTFFGQLVNSNLSDEDKIEQLALSALTRYPTDHERSVIRKLVARNLANTRGDEREMNLAQSLQDIFWAYLNSSEFVLVH